MAACRPLAVAGPRPITATPSPPEAIGEALGHGDRVVLVARPVEADAAAVERRGEDRGVVAHQAEHLLDAQRLEVVDEHLIGRRSGHATLPRNCWRSVLLLSDKHRREAMQGVVFTGDRQIELMTFPDPTPGPGQVVLEMKASGMCGSDLHQYRRPKGQVRAPACRPTRTPPSAGMSPAAWWLRSAPMCCRQKRRSAIG